jgi:hypothetical protein
MKFLTASFAAAAALSALDGASASTLKVVNVNAPAINCVFDATCKIVVSDTVGNLTFTPLGAGARLQSRTFAAKAGTPAAGHTGYLYRVDLTNGAGFTECTAGLVVNFGPVATLPYAPNNQAQVFVVTTGGLGSVGIKSAEQDGGVITFTFDKYLCAGQTSFFFGLAAVKAPVAATAVLFGIGEPAFVQVDARVPQH